MSETAVSLKGKRIVVVGGATGIGFAIAEIAHEQGASVVLGSSNQANVQAASERLQGATGYAVDLRDEGSVTGLFKQVGPFDHLTVTAGDWGGPMFVSIQDLDLAKAHELLSVRFWGALAAVKHCSSTIAKDGSITLTSGMIGHRPRKGTPVMAAVGGCGRTPDHWLGYGSGPSAGQCCESGLCPHRTTETDAGSHAAVSGSAVANSRAATPEEAAQAYVYLMLNIYATGQILPVDGGGLLV